MKITAGCELLRDDLKACRDGELSTARRLAVRWHLARCASCREEVSWMEQIENDLRAGEAGALDPALRAKLLANIGEGGAPIDSPAPTFPEPYGGRPLGVFGLTAVALVTGCVLVAVLMPVFSTARDKARYVIARPRAHAMYPQSYSGSDSPGGVRVTRNPASVGLTDLSKGREAGKAESMQLPSFERKVRKEASLTVAVTKLEESSDSIEKAVRDAGGFVASNNLSTGDDGGKSASLVTRVPVARFEAILGQIARLGEVKAKNVTGEDVTEQVSDAEQAEQVLADDARAGESRIRTVQQGNRDEWQRQQELRGVRIQLAQVRARLRLLRKDTALATITVSLQEKARSAPKAGGLLGDVNEAGHAAVTTFQTAVRLPVVLLIWILAYAPLWVPLAIAYRYAARAQQRRFGGVPRNV